MIFVYKSRRQKVFCKIGILNNFANFSRKYLCRSCFFRKIVDSRSVSLLKKYLDTDVFTVAFKKILEHLFRKTTANSFSRV